MDALLSYGRLIAPFAIDCVVKISVAAIAALLAAHWLGRRQPSWAFAFIVASFGLALVLILGRGLVLQEGGPGRAPAAARSQVRADPPSGAVPAAAPAGTVTPGLTAKYGSMFQIRIAKGPGASGDPAGAGGTPWIPALALVWLAGFLVLSACRLRGILAVRRLLRAAGPCRDRRLLQAGEAAREALGGRRAALLVSAAGHAAFVAGFLRPCIVLPAEAAAWPQGRLASTLLHEYMHVRRLDVPVAEGLRLLTSLAWLAPFPWLALALALRLRERVCDGAVLRAGIARRAYACDLLEAARSAARPATAAVSAGASNLEGRIRAILEGPAIPLARDRLKRAAAGALLLGAGLAAVRIAGPLYAMPESRTPASLPRGPGEWVAAADPRRGGLTAQGAFSLSLEGDYARVRLRYRGRTRDLRLASFALPTRVPLSARARMIVPFGGLVDGLSRKPFFNPGWSIWDALQVPVAAAAPGRVVVAGHDARYGTVIEVEHGDGLDTRYALGRNGTACVEPGEYVTAGTPLGAFSACSPYDLPVLNFSILVQVSGERVALDPAPFMLAAAENRAIPLAMSVVNAAVRLEDRAELQRLLARGVAPDHPSADGSLPLEWALLTENLAIARDLLAAGADPQASTWNVHGTQIALHGPSVAELARDSANPELAALLAPEAFHTHPIPVRGGASDVGAAPR